MSQFQLHFEKIVKIDGTPISVSHHALLRTVDPPEKSGQTRGANRRIGKYRLLEKIGEGGMGEVFAAEQTVPFKRMVALKVIKKGMDTREAVSHFEAERCALELMDHPSIPKLLDTGRTRLGCPYFVMEHINGLPITDHCDLYRLGIGERLELFGRACEGVQHAHLNGIIHCDLKPSNVLVAMRNGRELPRIIDFGLARAATHNLSGSPVFKESGELVGTPEYMSPEQTGLTGTGVDSRSDVYSLGVLLYHLLVGEPPFDSMKFRRGGLEAIRSKILKQEPCKPSTRLTLSGRASKETAKLRQVDLSSLQRQIAGDLDWITMRAIEKNRSRRYGSPSELAADVERFLNGQPVLATPPPAARRAKDFIRWQAWSILKASYQACQRSGFPS